MYREWKKFYGYLRCTHDYFYIAYDKDSEMLISKCKHCNHLIKIEKTKEDHAATSI